MAEDSLLQKRQGKIVKVELNMSGNISALYIDDEGFLVYDKVDSSDVDFSIDENGMLVCEYPAA